MEYKHGLAVAFMAGNELVALEHRDYRYYENDTVSYFHYPKHINRLFSRYVRKWVHQRVSVQEVGTSVRAHTGSEYVSACAQEVGMSVRSDTGSGYVSALGHRK